MKIPCVAMLGATAACSTSSTAPGLPVRQDAGAIDGSTEAAFVEGGDDDGGADGESSPFACLGLSTGFNIPALPCSGNQVCCLIVSGATTATSMCMDRATGCPEYSLPRGAQLCTTSAECLVPGNVCAFQVLPGPQLASCWPPPDPGAGPTLAVVDDGAIDASAAADAALSSDGAIDAPDD